MSTSWKAGTVCDLALCLQHPSPCRRAGIRPVKSGGRQKRDRRLLGLPSLPTSLSASPHIEPHSSWSPSFPRSPVYTPPPVKLGLRKTSAPSRTPFAGHRLSHVVSAPGELLFSRRHLSGVFDWLLLGERQGTPSPGGEMSRSAVRLRRVLRHDPAV